MNLKIDAGNRRVKWTSRDLLAAGNDSVRDDGEQGSGCVDTRSRYLVKDLENGFHALPKPDAIWVSCVGSPDIRADITSACTRLWEVDPLFLHSAGNGFGVRNCYTEKSTLGVDRWAALIAGRFLVPDSPLVIIDAGTAVTVDYLDESGDFPGGVIFPGLMTMLESLHSATGNIRTGRDVRLNEGAVSWLNDNSDDAVRNGVRLAVGSTVDSAIESHYARKETKPAIVVTGGDADIIRSMSRFKMLHFPDLVLVGVELTGRGTRI